MHFRLVMLVIVLTSNSLFSFGQKPLIDSSMFGNWPYVESPLISNNGKFALYTIHRSPLGNTTVKLKSIVDGWEMSFLSTTSNKCVFSDDSHYLLILDRKDSLKMLDLITRNISAIPSVQSYKVFSDEMENWLVYQVENSSQNLILLNLKTGKRHEYASVQHYEYDKPAHLLLLENKVTDENDKRNENNLVVVDVRTFNEKQLWKGILASNFIFDSSGTQLAFMSEEVNKKDTANLLRYYKIGTNESIILHGREAFKLEDTLVIDGIIKFNLYGDKVIINLAKTSQPIKQIVVSGVHVWSYKDAKLQAMQLKEIGQNRVYQAILDIKNHAIIRIEYEDEYVQDNLNYKNSNESMVMVIKMKNDLKEWNWNKEAYCSYYIVSTTDGSRKLVYKNKYASGNPSFNLSPCSKFALFYDAKEKNYFSYRVSNGTIVNITKRISASWELWAQEDRPKYSQGPLNIVGWIKDDSRVILCDRYDLFEVDPDGKLPPINVTNGYGRIHKIVFRSAFDQSISQFGVNDRIILNAFNLKNKNNGFYSAFLGRSANPGLLTMQPCIFIGPDESEFVDIVNPIKALDTNVYIFRRMTASASPNFYWTSDFKAFTSISNVRPELEYNWLTTELFNWKKLDGILAQGILYKPENFDPNRKYPVIIFYYEKLSEGLNAYIPPDYCDGPLNIPYFVSHGYLVFTPDISFKVGYPGNSVVNSVLSAAVYLNKLPFVNKFKIGLQGHSRGGYETNYLVTHTGYFAAASSACGMADYISLSLSLTEDGRSSLPGPELLSQRIGATLWQRPDLYISNSPIFKANRVTTPLLILANKKDNDVPFSQGLEFYLALRRLGKKAWMLQYEDEWHLLHSLNAKKDYTIRLMQFFDYYLKKSLPPKWMTEGIAAKFKDLDNKYEFDHSGTIP